jgi:hypothetical protein
MNTFQITNKLTNEYDKTYFDLIKSFQAHLKAIGKPYTNNGYSFLYPSFGCDFFLERKILFYGQCINGKWQPSFNLNDEIDSKIIEKGLEFSNTCDEGESSPLEWVNKNWSEFSLFRSFFWNVAYKLTNKLIGIEDYKNSAEWCKYMAWSNLMKVGNVLGGNPNQDEYFAQIDLSVKLFLMELDEIKPEIVILLSGLDFSEDFVFALGLKPNTVGKEFIIIADKFKDSKIILTRRPQFGSNEKCVEEIIEAISNL